MRKDILIIVVHIVVYCHNNNILQHLEHLALFTCKIRNKQKITVFG